MTRITHSNLRTQLISANQKSIERLLHIIDLGIGTVIQITQLQTSSPTSHVLVEADIHRAEQTIINLKALYTVKQLEEVQTRMNWERDIRGRLRSFYTRG